MLHQEQQNIQMLEQILQREKQAAQTIEQSLHGHELAIQRCQEVVNICNQMQHEVIGASTSFGGYSPNTHQPFTNPNQYQTSHFTAQTPFQQ
jgi:DNA-binding protein H-NS